MKFVGIHNKTAGNACTGKYETRHLPVQVYPRQISRK